MKVLIIDDSRLARAELRHLLEEIGDVTIAGEARHAEEAKARIAELKPDLLLLDIQMPGEDGFELLAGLDEAPEVIFVTAYDAYALKAFDFNALDYLRKPIDKDRLAAALAKAREKIGRRQAAIEANDQLGPESQIFVKDGEQCWFVKLAEVRLFEVEGSYTALRFESHRPLIPRTLNYLETRLDPKVFFRANRQQMINLRWVERIEPWFSGGLKVFLRGGDEVEVSRRQALKFKELMSL